MIHKRAATHDCDMAALSVIESILPYFRDFLGFLISGYFIQDISIPYLFDTVASFLSGLHVLKIYD